MSHLTTCELKVKDLACLKAACPDRKLEFRENQTSHRWYGTRAGGFAPGQTARLDGRCLHAIGVPGNREAYEVGIIRSADGTGYELVYDDFQGGYGLEKQTGRGCGLLLQSYAQQVARKEMAHAEYGGYQYLEEKELPGGVKEMVFERELAPAAMAY